MDIQPFLISRVFNAPIDKVWEANTNCEHLKHWWGPKGCKVIYCKIDARAGGVFHYCLEFPNGLKMWGKFDYLKVEPKTKLEFISSFSDENGGITQHPMAPDWPRRMITIVEFADEGGKTKMSVNWKPFEPTEAELRTFTEGFDSMRQGWTGTMEKLETYLA